MSDRRICMTQAEEYKLREQICETGRKMWQLGFVAGNDGNISVKLGDDTFLTTPSGVSKGDMTPDMILRVNSIGGFYEGDSELKPSSEFKMHLRCYETRSDVGAVVHAHPPFATAFAGANVPLDQYGLSEAVMCLGSVPVTPFAVPGTTGVADSIEPFLCDHDALLLMNHGALTLGRDLTQAYYRMETLEHTAKITLAASLIGGLKEIPRDKIDECCELGRAMGIRNPGYVKYRQ